MPKIAFIGAGSYGFTRRLVGDILTYPALQDVELAFMDIDEKRLGRAETVIRKLIENKGLPLDPIFSLDRDPVIEGADFIVNLVKIGMIPPSYMDIDVPKKYGLQQTIGDTSCVGGVFRGLRAMPWVIELCGDIHRLCPAAVVLNYTNPQAMLVMTADAVSDVPYIGLCHSVQGTTRQIARFLDVPYEEMAYEAAGINHMNWITRLQHDGEDLYPRLRSIIREHGVYEPPGGPDGEPMHFLGPARLDMLNRVGYVVTESSTHFPEYVPFYARTDELIERYKVPVDQYKRNMERKAKQAEEFYQQALDDELEPVDRSVEYGCQMINSMVTDTPVRVYANVMNDSLVDNLPEFSAVEVAGLVDRNGVHPCRFGDLPNNVAAMCRMEINVHQLAVEAILERDRRKVYQALMMDPLTHSVMTIDEIEHMVDELVEGQQEWLGEYLGG
jgi:alpha-galactosidase